MLGIIVLQTYWIREAIGQSTDQFNKNVQEALYNISERLEKLEEEELSDILPVRLNNPAIPNGLSSVTSILNADSMLIAKGMPVRGLKEDSPISDNALLYQHPRFSFEGPKPQVLEERINPEQLDEILSKELKNRGLDTKYEYGVFSNLRNQLVIKNGHYVIIDEGKTSQVTEVREEALEPSQSKYSVDLFKNEMNSPGKLEVYFPAKSSIIWRSVWLPLIASFLFSVIVLFCFYYTINVIFTQKKLAEMKTDFINNMTHEFKTPIATISLAADSITSPRVLHSEDKIKRFAGIIKQENKRMNNQVEKVLQMALLEKRDLKLNLTEIHLHEVITQAVANSQLQVDKKGGKVKADLKASTDKIEADLTHISNVIHNLLDNANKYSPENPEIIVGTRNVKNGVEVIVQDNGIGMSKEARKHIFDKFYRVHTGNLHDVKGFGLGLSYVKTVLDAHKGSIDVKSELGKGSSFILTFPFRQSHEI